jgi:apolipoprotein N-acyltransferase
MFVNQFSVPFLAPFLAPFLNQTQIKFQKYLLPIIAGILIGTSYIPFQPWALLFCLSPLFIFWMSAASYKDCFIAGFITQFILNLIGFHWIYSLASEFGHFPGWLSFIILILFAALAHLYFAFAGLIWFVLKKSLKLGEGSQLILLACIFALLQKYFPVLFPWHFGYEWYFAKLKVFQLADIIGFEGLNIIAIFSSLAFTKAYLLREGRRKKMWLMYSVPFIALLILNTLGTLRERALPVPDQLIKTLVIQGNIGNSEKIYAERGRGFQDFILKKFLDQSESALAKNPDSEILVWPETAFADHLDNTFQFEPRNIQMRKFAQIHHIHLITGAYHEDPRLNLIYNSMFFIEPTGLITQKPYDKNILLAFGEYVPFSKYFPKVLKWLDLAEFGRGDGSHLLMAKDIQFGPQICYEGLYSDIARKISQQGAEVIMNITNDSWYGKKFEPFQHLYMTAARAVEFRRPLIRATNTGISTVILANGDFLERSPVQSEWSHEFLVPFLKNPEHTIYERFFYMWDIFLGLLIFGIITNGLIEEMRHRGRT